MAHIADTLARKQAVNDAKEMQGTYAKYWNVVKRLRVGSSRVDLQACKLEYSIVSPK